eukprot:TRINITY_DN4609_c0_g2_i5.p1 TRINITY_DN4609_c0_g2~~TRINITY_DN4609_c0_g2_i5.p1  ORF type:complete len:528 (+),score=133.22 TRINITY_DN4609_c0_g2_i5:107-1690(+)
MYWFGLLLIIWGALCREFSEHKGYLDIPPNEDVYYYLRVIPSRANPLLVWLGHTPAHAIDYYANDTAILPLEKEVSFVLFDLPDVGLTRSSYPIKVDMLVEFVRLSLDALLKKYPEYRFTDIWIGGERYMTPLATLLAEKLTSCGKNVQGLIMGNPYLEGRISIPKRLGVLKHFGLLDTEKEEQFTFLNNLCAAHTSMDECNRTEKLFGILTNMSLQPTKWAKQYINSILHKPNYLFNLIDLIKSRKYKILLYTSQIDLNSGFQRVYSALQYFNVCDPPQPLTYYLHKKATKGFYIQNSCWTLLNVYNSTGNVTHSQPEVMGSVIEEFTRRGNLSCEGQCDMEGEITKTLPNCKLLDWSTGKYVCKCTKGKHGATCTIDVQQVLVLDSYQAYINNEESVYIEYASEGKGSIELVREKDDCTMDMYANFYTEGEELDTPTEKRHTVHTRTDVLYTPDRPSIVMLKIKSQCVCEVKISLKYYKHEVHNSHLYLALSIAICLLIVSFVVAMIVIYVKARQKRNSPSFIRS